jgi:hypothetical protein
MQKLFIKTYIICLGKNCIKKLSNCCSGLVLVVISGKPGGIPERYPDLQCGQFFLELLQQHFLDTDFALLNR